MSALRTISVCLVFVLPSLSSAQNQSCQLTAPPSSCNCSGFSLTCVGHWPSQSELQAGNSPQEMESLTITQTVHTDLNSCNSTFEQLFGLRTLDLSSNHIKYVKPESFSSYCFPNLEELILDNNTLRMNVPTTFSQLTRLTKLSLNGALEKHRSMSKNLTHTLSKLNLLSLKELWLNDNGLGPLNSNTFHFSDSRNSNTSNQSSLSRIHLRNNTLGIITPNTFEVEWLPSLTFIDLSLNNITGLVEENVDNFDKFPSLTVNLTGNPFTCNCNLRDFIEWLNRTEVTVVDKNKILCSKYSFSHVGSPIVEVAASEVNCTVLDNINLDDQLKSSYILLIAVLSLIGLLAVIILFMRRKEIVQLCSQMKQATKETFDTHHTTYIYSDINRATRDTPEHSAVDV